MVFLDFFESWNETKMISHQLNTPAYTAPADCHHVGKPMAHREEDRRTYGDIKQKKSRNFNKLAKPTWPNVLPMFFAQLRLHQFAATRRGPLKL